MNSSKVWIIDPEILRQRKKKSELQGSSGMLEYQGASTSSGPPDSGLNDNSGRNHQKRSALLMLLTYLLGPLSPLVLREGRRSRVWLSVAIGSAVASTVIVMRWSAVFSRPGEGSALIPVWIFVICLTSLAGFAAWTHTALLMGRLKGSFPRYLPKWIKRPWAAGSLGFVFPGLGLLITGHRKRAALALWMVWALLVSSLVLSKSAWLWTWGQGAGFTGSASRILEYVILAVGAVAFLGALAWIIQGLDGVRLAGRRSSRQGHNPRGEWPAVALLAAIVASTVLFEPASVARALDRFAVSKRQDGFQIVPLCLTRAAMHLDPSQPEYVIHAAALYDDLGRNRTADVMRDELYERWRPCTDMMGRQGLLPSDGVSSMTLDGVHTTNGETGESKEGWTGTWDRINALYGGLEIQAGNEPSGEPRPNEAVTGQK